MICSKLLRNETVFRSYVESTAEIKYKRDSDKIIEVADLRQVLYKFGVSYINQDIFIREFSKNEPVHIEDLITRMKNCYQLAYNLATSTLNRSQDELKRVEQGTEYDSMNELRRTDYFDKV